VGFGSPDALNKFLISWRDFPWKRGEERICDPSVPDKKDGILLERCAVLELTSCLSFQQSCACCFTYDIWMSLKAA